MGGEMGTRLMIVLTERMFAMLLLYQHYTGYSNQLANETNCFNEEVAHLLFFHSAAYAFCDKCHPCQTLAIPCVFTSHRISS